MVKLERCWPWLERRGLQSTDPVGRSFALEPDDFSSNRHPALSFCLSMISAQTLRVCREGKPVPTFPDHALGFRGSPQLRINDSARVGSISKNAGFLHRSSSPGTLGHRAGLNECRLRFGDQIRFWPLVFSHGEKATSQGVNSSVRWSTLRPR